MRTSGLSEYSASCKKFARCSFAVALSPAGMNSKRVETEGICWDALIVVNHVLYHQHRSAHQIRGLKPRSCGNGATAIEVFADAGNRRVRLFSCVFGTMLAL